MPLAFEAGALYVFRSRTFCAYMHYGSRKYAALLYIAKITSPVQVAGMSSMKNNMTPTLFELIVTDDST
jgi:hypothetical protein